MRKLLILLFLFLLALVTVSSPPLEAANPKPAQPVSLRPEAVIEGPLLTLGDIFEGLDTLADTTVAQAPAPGGQLRLSAQWLQRLARAYGLAWQPRPGLTSLRVERSSQIIGQTEIAAALGDALSRQGIGGDLDIVLDNAGLALHLPVGGIPELQVASLSFDPRSERIAARIRAVGEDGYQVRALVRGRALQMTEVPMLRHQLGSDQVIGQQDLEWRRIPTARLGRQTLTDPAEMLGKSPRRSLRPGRPLRAGDLQTPVVVARNSLVTLSLRTRFMRLTVQGRALENGGLGDVVRVVNIKSNAVVHGVVAAPNRVVLTSSAQDSLHQEASR